MFDQLFVACQHLIPKNLLSRTLGHVAECTWPWLKEPLIKHFIRIYGVNMSEAENPDYRSYRSFNDFFTRPLKNGARPIDADETVIVSPADGAMSQWGAIEQGRIIQAKGQSYSLLELLGGHTDLAEPFQGGQFSTIYLCPADYHRLHMPIAGTLRSMVHIPGELFSVNMATAQHLPRLFARNERVVAIFDTELGPMAMVLVGAMIVASIETVWAGQITPVNKTIQRWDYSTNEREPITLDKGQEMGRFKLGSTVILCFPDQALDWQHDLAIGGELKMGSRIAITK